MKSDPKIQQTKIVPRKERGFSKHWFKKDFSKLRIVRPEVIDVNVYWCSVSQRLNQLFSVILRG